MTRSRGLPNPRTTARAPAGRLRLEALEDRTVPGISFDPITGRGELGGHTFYALTNPPPPPRTPRDGPGPQAPPFDPTDTFRLHSDPTAQQVIYLDFTGHTTTGTSWNDAGRSSIVTPPFDLDGNPASFSGAEVERIQRIWQRVAEDFIPFDVDVTTEAPGVERLQKTGPNDTQWGIRAIVGGDGAWFGDAAGVGFVGSFNWDADTGCFVFADALGGNEKYIADDISHEVGHTLGLEHDGRTSPSEEYYAGQGTGPTGWAPIMGVDYYEELTQWSKGEYLNANNTQDDLAIITSQNGFGYRADDHGDFSSAATPATVTERTHISGSGIIERSTDADVFGFTAGAGPVAITVSPADRGPNLDILAELFDAFGNRIASDNPPDQLGATLRADVPAGQYFLRIEGTGKGDPLGGGYTDYDSLGQYSFVGTIPDPNPPPPLEVVGAAALESVAGTVRAVRVTFNEPVDPRSFRVGNVRVTGPTGAGIPILRVRAASLDRTQYDFRIAPQRLAGPGGVRVFVGPAVRSTAGRFLDQGGDGTPGETADYFAAAAYRFSSDAGGPIADGGTTDFPLVIDRGLTIRDVNVRVNLTHPYVGDLEVQLVSPVGKVVELFNHRGGDGNDLRNTRFDDEATRRVDAAAAPYAGVFRPDGGTLADLIGDDAQGTWLLRVTDAFAGAAGQLNSWSVTVTTDSAQSGVALPGITAINETGSSAATRVGGLELQFDRPMNPATVTPADVRVLDPFGRPVRVLSVDPVAGTDGALYLAATVPWLRAGTYTVRVGPRVADIYGNGLDVNGDGAFLEPGDAVIGRPAIDNDVFASRQRPQLVPSSGSVTGSLAVGRAVRIGRLAVEVNVQHPTVGNLRITLVAPDGQEFLLADHRGGTGDNFVRTIFSDDAAVAIGDPSAPAPFRGDYRPEQALTPLIGTLATGTWKLRVEDTGAGDLGELLSWGLYVVPR